MKLLSPDLDNKYISEACQGMVTTFVLCLVILG